MIENDALTCDGCGKEIPDGEPHLSINLLDIVHVWEADWCDECASKVGPFLQKMGIRRVNESFEERVT